MATKTMISSPITTLHPHSSPVAGSHSLHPLHPCIGSVVLKGSNLQCKAVSKSRTQGYLNLLQENSLPSINWGVDTQKILPLSDEIKVFVERIKMMLGSMDEGEISISAYDTAWVALLQDVNGSGGPQFSSSLDWIVENQLPDGSWGDRVIFLAHDRIINTLACVIALTSWNIHPNKCQKGLNFLNENISKLEVENKEHMSIGFEVAFPSLIDIARKLDIAVPEDSPALKEIIATRNLKLTKIPKNILHTVPTTLLYSLEGMPDLEWEKLLNLQCKDGSFLFSPSSTAFAFMQTKDEKCLQYLTNVVTKFSGGVPCVYPVDLFEHIWVIDRLQRLGISRYFDSEIKNCADYIYKYWTEDGICWAKNSNVQDIDDTSMGFRVLRMCGYKVSPDVFRKFEKDGKFVCYAGQTTQGVTEMFNLFRASQVLFPNEKILDDAKNFSYNLLKEKHSTNELLDKWIIAKDLPGEVRYALDVPWYASLPRLETRFYLEQYGGGNDVWIGKTLYRMGNLNNDTYLEMAKLDYNNCLTTHHLEWKTMQQWYVDFGITRFGTSGIRDLLVSYYLASSSIFEPERSTERIAWAKTTTLVDNIFSFFVSLETSNDQRREFIEEYRNMSNSIHHVKNHKPSYGRLMVALKGMLHEIAMDVLMTHHKDIHPQLQHAWEMWLMRWQEGIDMTQGQAELIVQTINMTAGCWVSKELLAHPQYRRLSTITNKICQELSHFYHSKNRNNMQFNNSTVRTLIDSMMQEIVQLVLSESPTDLDKDLKQTFLTVAKTFYYKAYYDPETINIHISKVMFETII